MQVEVRTKENAKTPREEKRIHGDSASRLSRPCLCLLVFFSSWRFGVLAFEFFSALKEELPRAAQIVGVDQVHAGRAEQGPRLAIVRRAPEAQQAALAVGFLDDLG